MDNISTNLIFDKFITKNFKISLIFLYLGMFFGIVYSINLLGYSLDSNTLFAPNMRSLHISLMLYGFVPVMLSYLPFLLINKEVGSSKEGIYYLNLYTIFWNIFLVFMISSLLFGNTRGLAFYDFPYELNFILAFAGLFYIIALYKFIKLYKVTPLWIKVCLRLVIIAPIALIILMNPIIGQVEKTVSGPHGDNTLGMSLALIPIYYLIIKLLSQNEFKARWNIFWIIPLIGYASSVIHRSFIGALSYEQEWFFQYLTLLYIPLLYRWYKDADIEKYAKLALLISIAAFLFVDIEGNILFIPEIRWLFHRNDLIVAHAHVAMGIGVFFMVICMYVKYIKELRNSTFYYFYLAGIISIFLVLSISGFTQAGFNTPKTENMWLLRTIFGVVTFASIIAFINLNVLNIKTLSKYTNLQKYNFISFLSDGLGGLFLILFGQIIYNFLGFYFDEKYIYIIFYFVTTTGLLHLFAFIFTKHEKILTQLTALIRVFVSSVFFALFMSKALGYEALLICVVDIAFATTYFILFHRKDLLCKDCH